MDYVCLPSRDDQSLHRIRLRVSHTHARSSWHSGVKFKTQNRITELLYSCGKATANMAELLMSLLQPHARRNAKGTMAADGKDPNVDLTKPMAGIIKPWNLKRTTYTASYGNDGDDEEPK
jgi:hypothetical protein